MVSPLSAGMISGVKIFTSLGVERGGFGGCSPPIGRSSSGEEVLRLEPGRRVSTQSQPAKRSCKENRRGAPLAGIRLFSLQGRCRVAQVAILMLWSSAAVLRMVKVRGGRGFGGGTPP